MNSIDVITQYCVYNDYPIFRYNMQRFRHRFDKIILYPSRHHGYIDLEEWTKKIFPETWVERENIDYGVQDWRQAETEPLLKHSNAEWLYFAEQDFFVKDWDMFWALIDKTMPKADAIGWWNPTAFPYIHPSCFLIRREVFEKTKKDFRAHPEIPGADHFAMLTRDLEDMNARIVKLQDIGYENWTSAFHLGGLTYPYQNWKGDGTDHYGVGNPEAFYVYNHFSRHAPVVQNKGYLDLSKAVEKGLEERYGYTANLKRTNVWREFFKQWA